MPLRSVRVRPFAAFFAIVSVFVFVASLYAWTERRSLARRLILAQLPDGSPMGVAFTIERIDLGGFELRDLTIGPEPSRPDLRLESLRASYSLASLFTGRVTRLDLEGLRIRGELTEAGLVFGTLDSLRGTASSDEEDPGSLIPPGLFALRRIEVRDAELSIEGAAGEGVIQASVLALASPMGNLSLELELTARHPRASGKASWHGEASREAIEGELELWLGEGPELENPADAQTSRREIEVRGILGIRDGMLSFDPEGCIALTVPAGGMEDVFDLTGPLALCARSHREPGVRIALAEEAGLRVDVALATEPAPLAGHLLGEGETLRFEGELPGIVVRSDDVTRPESQELEIEARGGRFFVPLYEFEVSGLDLKTSALLEPLRLSGELTLAHLFNRERPENFPALSLAARFEPEGEGHAFRLDFSDPTGSLRIEIEGQHDSNGTGGAGGHASLRVPLLAFDPAGLQPGDLVSALRKVVTRVEGGVAGKGSLAWEGGEIRADLELEITPLSFTSEWGDVEGLRGSLAFAGPFPFYTRAAQRLEVSRLTAGIELRDGVIDFQLRRDGRFDLDRMHWSVAGGNIVGRGRFDPLASHHDLRLDVQELELAELLALVELDGLSGTGSISGSLPLRWEGESIAIRGGALRAAEGGGWIRYRPDSSAGAMAGRNAELGMLVGVLENFRYESLAVEVNGDALADVQLALKLEGANPDYQGGMPIEFNLNLEAALIDLLRSAAATEQISESVRKKLE